MDDEKLEICPPLYLIGQKIGCWKCEAKMPAVALLASNVKNLNGEVIILSEITSLPNEILKFLQKRVPTFKYRFSKTVNSKYYANTCPSCGVISGDFFLHSEPGGPFFPEDESKAKGLYMTEIPIRGTVSIESGYHVGTGELILNNAKRIA